MKLFIGRLVFCRFVRRQLWALRNVQIYDLPCSLLPSTVDCTSLLVLLYFLTIFHVSDNKKEKSSKEAEPLTREEIKRNAKIKASKKKLEGWWLLYHYSINCGHRFVFLYMMKSEMHAQNVPTYQQGLSVFNGGGYAVWDCIGDWQLTPLVPKDPCAIIEYHW